MRPREASFSQSSRVSRPLTTTIILFRGIASLLLWFVVLSTQSYAWDYGDGRHGSFGLTTNTTIEQLYLSVRLPADPAQYNPVDPRAVPNFKNLTVTNNAVLTTNPWNGTTGGWIVC